MKKTWQTSSLNPPTWWQLHLGKGLITISIQYKNGQTFELNTRKAEISIVQAGYHTQIGSGLAVRENVLPTLETAKAWGLQAASEALQEMQREARPDVPWLLCGCFFVAIVLQSCWLLLFR